MRVGPEARSKALASELVMAARECGIVWAGMFVLGIGFGVVVTGYGFPWWLGGVVSGAVFAGSVEFVLVGMLATSAPLASVALTTLMVNSRHLFYGLSFPLHRVDGLFRRAYSVFLLCDEAFAILASKDASTLSSARILWTQIGMHASWAGGSFAGGAIGVSVLDQLQGMQFVLTSLFVVLTMDATRGSTDKLEIVLAGGAAALGLAVAPGSLVPVALSIFTCASMLRFLSARRLGFAAPPGEA